jgi:hypothetical protein
MLGSAAKQLFERIDFRYSNRVALGVNGERAVLAVKGIEGKRLTYRATTKSIA